MIVQQSALLILPVAAGAVLWLGLSQTTGKQITEAVTASATVLAVWVAALAAFFGWRSSNQQILMQLRTSLQRPEITRVLTVVGEMYDEELRAFQNDQWRIWDSLGVRYLQAIQTDPSLHSARRELTYTYDQVCALFVHGLISRRTALGLFTNLEERSAMFTALEEMLALSVSCRKYSNAERDRLVEDWNRSRRFIFPRFARRIEVGKPNMRAVSGLRLVLDPRPSRCDYEKRLFVGSVSDLFVPGEPQAPIVLRLVAPPHSANIGIQPPASTLDASGPPVGGRA